MSKEDKKNKKIGFSFRIGNQRVSYEGRLPNLPTLSEIKDLTKGLGQGIEAVKEVVSAGTTSLGKTIAEVGKNIESAAQSQDKTEDDRKKQD